MKTICAVTSSRADFSLLAPSLKALGSAPGFSLQLVVMGPADEAVERGFRVDRQLPFPSALDSREASADIAGWAINAMADALSQLKPDLVFLIGDRYEILSAAFAASLMNIPVAHTHGGELTAGAFDDSFRHAITKLSSIHFTAHADYQRRVIQMGEKPSLVFNIGAPGVEGIRHQARLPRSAVEEVIGLSLNKPTLLVTFHPVTRTDTSLDQLAELLAALDNHSRFQVIFTSPNRDPQGKAIAARIENYCERHSEGTRFFDSLGTHYISTLAFMRATVGNSSSGILEAPYLGVPTIDIGSRQKGRVKCAGVISCEPARASIENALMRIEDPDFLERCKKQILPFGEGDFSARLLACLSHLDWSTLSPKGFYDLPGGS